MYQRTTADAGKAPRSAPSPPPAPRASAATTASPPAQTPETRDGPDLLFVALMLLILACCTGVALALNQLRKRLWGRITRGRPATTQQPAAAGVGNENMSAALGSTPVVSPQASPRPEQKRLESLTQRFGAENTQRILKEEIWIGATAEMLRESMGPPEEVDRKVLKTKTKEIWKYGLLQGNSYIWRITLENGVVVSWQDKSV